MKEPRGFDRDLARALDRWLAAEGSHATAATEASETTDVDEALRAVFVRLPDPFLPPGLAPRIMAVVAAERRRAAPLNWWSRALLAACLALAGLALTVLPGPVMTLLPRLGLARALSALSSLGDGLVALFGWIGEGAAFWGHLANLGTGVARLAGTPPVAWLLLASAALSAAAFVCLHRLLLSERSVAYADLS